jgi:ribulose 1,5-bisphosphate synthetase/thiazole synthase
MEKSNQLDLEWDVIVIGAGISGIISEKSIISFKSNFNQAAFTLFLGLTAAYTLKTKSPNELKILILEAKDRVGGLDFFESEEFAVFANSI